MNDCLVTKLKGVVDNPNLLKMDEMTFKTSLMMPRTINVSGETVHCEIISGNNTFTGGVTSIDITNATTDADATFTDPTALTEVKINNKYNLRYFWINDGEIDFSKVKYSKLDSFVITGNNSKVHGLVSCKNIHTIVDLRGGELTTPQRLSEIFNVANDSIVGITIKLKGIIHEDDELNVLGKFINLAAFNLKGVTSDGEFRGTIEGFVQAARLAGRETCEQMNVVLPPETLITFNGNNAGNASTYPTPLLLSWTATTITYNGVTINA